MSLQSLLTELTQLDVKLKLLNDEQLSISAPKGRLSKELMTRLSESKPQLIEWLKQSLPEAKEETLPLIVPDPINLYQPFPSADLQTAFLMGDSEDMEYYVRPHYYLEQELGSIDPARYEKAINAVLHRQRANLVVVNQDMQLQTLREFTPITVPVQDLRGLSADDAETALLRTRNLMARQTLPLDRWPWFECRISLYGENKARLHFNNNNVFSDGYSAQKLMTEALHYYQFPEQPLPPLSLSFRDCVLALAALEESPQGLASQRYWLDRLPQLPGPPPVPRKAGVNPRMRSKLERREAVLPEQAWSSLKQRGRQFGLTPTNVLFAIYAELISCWSGTRHFLLNNMVTHRFPMHPEVKEIIGNFASLYPLEVDWRETAPFYQRARKLQERIMTDLRHVHWSGVKVLQTLNQFQKTPGQAPVPFVVGSGLFMKPYDQPYVGCLETPQVVLDHQFWELSGGELWFVWDLIEACFPEGMIDAMWSAYQALLMRLAQDESAWSETAFDMLPEDQRRQRAQINNTTAPVPDGLLHEPLAKQTMRHADKPAVIANECTLSFAELRNQAARLANRLLAAGVLEGELVAIMLDKGPAQAIAAFGILGAGAAYVPLDPEWPQDRIDYLLASTRAKVVVTRQALRENLLLPANILAMDVDDDKPSRVGTGFCAHAVDAPNAAAWAVPAHPTQLSGMNIDDANTSPPPPAQSEKEKTLEKPGVSPGSLAYIIFTSGSTGQPKGVMIDHRGALNTVTDINRRFGVSDTDVVFGISSLYFDLSVYDLFGTMAAGATLVLPDAAEATSPHAWLDTIREHKVTVWNSVPALMQLLVDAALAAGVSLPSLRLVMLSGDWIPVTLPQQIRQVAPNARVVSLGGATEASIWSIYYPVDRTDANWVSVPYGRPLANQHWHVLNDDGKDCPAWVPGHLYIGGSGLALGYWEDKAKTDAAFVRHPVTGERLYRTGDLGRYLPDGNIEFLGRSDFQVKIQGFRVELGEIEQALLSFPGIRLATVLAEGTAAGKRLLAFVVPEENAQPSAEAMQKFLRSKLPRYMVPAQISMLEQLPLTANGKVNRQELLKSSNTVQQEKRAYAAPVSTIEKELVAIWEEVLAVSPVGIDDDFFELGGQSFAAVRVMTRIARQFGHRLPLSVLLEGRTIAFLAQRLQQGAAWSPLVPVNAQRNGRACFFVHPAGGNVLCYRGLGERMEQPLYGLQAAGLSGEQPALHDIEKMAALYAQAIRQVQPSGPYLLGGWSSGGVIAFAIAQLLEQQGEVVERVLMLDTPAPLQHDPVDDTTMLAWFLEDLNVGFSASLLKPGELDGLGLTDAITLLGQRGHLSETLEPAQLEAVYVVFRGIIEGCRQYHPTPINAPISLLRASEGRVSEFIGHPADHAPDWGWAGFTRGTVSHAMIPGSHYTILSPQHGEALSAAIKHYSGLRNDRK